MQKRPRSKLSSCLIGCLSIFIGGNILLCCVGLVLKQLGVAVPKAAPEESISIPSEKEVEEQDKTIMPPLMASSIEDDLIEEIVEDNIVGTEKRSLVIRLKSKTSIEQLEIIAKNMKGKGKQPYKRTFMSYYVPRMDIGKGAWATTHFAPSLQVQILGLTIEEEQSFLAVRSGSNVIGKWIWEGSLPRVVILYRQSAKLYLESLYKDGSRSSDHISERIVKGQRELHKQNANEFGEYWVINSQGDLEEWDREGFIDRFNRYKDGD